VACVGICFLISPVVDVFFRISYRGQVDGGINVM
jgi:hypothetical protein